jgi:ABC-2 type transport system permease protein
MTHDSKVFPAFPVIRISPACSLASLVTQRAWKAWAFFKRDLATDLSYKLSFAFEVVHILIAVAAYYFLAALLGDRKLNGYDSFPFILIGLTVNAYMTTCLACFAQAIRGSQLTGTLKAILATPTSPTGFLMFSSAYPLARATLDGGVYMLGGLALGLSLARGNLVAAALLFIASLLAFSAIGMLSATFTVLFKRGDPLPWLFGSGSWLLGGVLYPSDVLPSSLQYVAELLPITHALRGLRAALLTDAPVAQILPEVGVLMLFAGVGLPLSIIAFKLALQRAKIIGTIGHQ